mmetsp:Transcript_21883/g.35234  ORF Transcript_21883/g.35234 Transcript_21883/m.35234 type:complete len:683 (+) Transcript_21883:211-2259(+)
MSEKRTLNRSSTSFHGRVKVNSFGKSSSRALVQDASGRSLNSPHPRTIRIVAKESALHVKPRKRNLKALAGLRTLATLWIVLGHFQQTAYSFNESKPFVLVLGRGFIPVCMYILLSGFVTHYAYNRKVYNNRSEVAIFLTRRLGRVLFTYFASIVLGLLDPLYTRHDALATNYPQEVLASVFLIQSWFELPDNDRWSRDKMTQPNPGGWTISTLLFAWFMYPLLNTALRKFNVWSNGMIRYKLALAFAMYAMTMIPVIGVYAGQHGLVTNGQFEFFYKFPPLRLGDFVLGMVLSELVEDPKCNASRVWRYLPDLATLCFAGIVIFVQLNGTIPLHRVDSETFLISGLAPLLGIMLLGYSINSDKKLKWSFSALFEHVVLIEVGNWSFAVYCFQFTVFFMFEQWQFSNIQHGIYEAEELKLAAPWLFPYLITLYTFSAMWTELLEKPFAQRIKIWTGRRFSSKEKSRNLVLGGNLKANAESCESQWVPGNGTRQLPAVHVEIINDVDAPLSCPHRLEHKDSQFTEQVIAAGQSFNELCPAASSPSCPSPAVHTNGWENVKPNLGNNVAQASQSTRDISIEQEQEEEEDTIPFEIAIQGSESESDDDKYESDPEYEKNKKLYDYIPDTDDEGDVSMDDSTKDFVCGLIDNALQSQEDCQTNPEVVSTEWETKHADSPSSSSLSE